MEVLPGQVAGVAEGGLQDRRVHVGEVGREGWKGIQSNLERDVLFKKWTQVGRELLEGNSIQNFNFWHV